MNYENSKNNKIKNNFLNKYYFSYRKCNPININHIIICLKIILLLLISNTNKIKYIVFPLESIPNITDFVCTLGRNENRYIREYVQHCEKCGVD